MINAIKKEAGQCDRVKLEWGQGFEGNEMQNSDIVFQGR